MKVTYNWLKDFVDIKISPRALADQLTMAGLEVTSLEERDADFVFELEVTSNRPDWLSVIGIAREIAAITGKKFKLPKLVQSPPCRTGRDYRLLSINIEDKKDCPLYTAKIITGVRVGPSPDWLKKRLELIGCRSINNIVDVTNYILFTWGEPLHAFDLDKLSSHRLDIFVRRAKEKEEIITIDGIKRALDKDILLIAGREKTLAIAGVMGSKDTEVTESTKNILLEAAVFNPLTIRRLRQRLGIQTDSAYRFERGVVPQIVKAAAKAAAGLINEIAGGACVLTKSSGLARTKKIVIALQAEAVYRILGVQVNAGQIKKILTGLQFKVKAKSQKIQKIEIPAHRQDVKSEIDLIEELARIYGYENIPKTLPPVYPAVSVSKMESLLSIIKNTLVALGLNEVITYSLIDRAALDGLEAQYPRPLEILNPLSKEQETLRPTLIPSLLKCVAYNLNQKQEPISIFELASSFSGSEEGLPEEKPVLGIALAGTKSLLLEQGAVKEELGMLHLKGILEALFSRLGIKEYNFNVTAPGCIAVSAGGESAGKVLAFPGEVLGKFGIKNKNVVALELYLDRLLACADLKKKFTGLPLFPGISRDISLVVKEGAAISDMLLVVKSKARDLLVEVKVIDYYRGKQIPEGFKGLTISCLYRSDERTLTEAEINPLHFSICNELTNKFGAKIR